MNEAYFRQWNERVTEQWQKSSDKATFSVACEQCSSLECTGRITLTPAEYEEIHEDQAVHVIPGHVALDIESSVLETNNFEVVRKRGRAGEVAEELAGD